MPIPILLIGAVIFAGGKGISNGIQGLIYSSEADTIEEEAEYILRKTRQDMITIKYKTNCAIEELGKTKIKVLAEEINDFIKIYSNIEFIKQNNNVLFNELEKLNITSNDINEVKNTSVCATKLLKSSFVSVGSGVLLGWGVYGSVMAFGTASTGTAIGGLSGIAATNATLAWLGGGSLAVGGGGIALGTTILGCIIAAPALLIAGGIYNSNSKEKLDHAYINLAEANRISSESNILKENLNTINKHVGKLNEIIKNLAISMKKFNCEIKDIVSKKTNWSYYTESEKYTIINAIKTFQAIKKVLDTKVLTEDGLLTEDTKELVLENRLLIEDTKELVLKYNKDSIHPKLKSIEI